jgi:predicted DNA repair protein MutK
MLGTQQLLCVGCDRVAWFNCSCDCRNVLDKSQNKRKIMTNIFSLVIFGIAIIAIVYGLVAIFVAVWSIIKQNKDV